MPTTEMIVMVAIVAAAVLVLVHLLRLAGTAIRHRTLRRAIEIHPEQAEQLLKQIPEPQGAGGDDRLGMILVAVGVAMIGASMTAGATGGWVDYGIGGALFPLFVGGALWLRHGLTERARRRREQGQ